MGNTLKLPLDGQALADAIGLESVGSAQHIRRVMSLADASAGCLCFSKNHLVSLPPGCVAILPAIHEVDGAMALVSAHPRLDFARALQWIDESVGFESSTATPVIHSTSRVGVGCAIANGVQIGAHTVVANHVTIGQDVRIGEHCIIKSVAVIGEPGFGFERDESGLPIRLIHLGSVVIGDNVEVGSVTTVCRGTLGDTILEDFVKIDDHVHIAHNTILRRGAMVIACAELSGGVEVGEGAWIGPNASIIQQRKIGRGALVGIGANVLKDVPEGMVVAGNPAKPLSNR